MKIGRKTAAILITGLLVLVIVLVAPMTFPRYPRVSQTSKVEVEIAVLERALNSFRSEFGSRVPGSLQLTEDLAELAPRDRSALRRLWPQLNLKAQYDFNNDGDMEDTFQLNGAECLVFFLGGIRQNETPTGFSRNPLQPFSPDSLNRVQFFEFEVDRLTDVDSDGFPEYADGLSKAPFIYVNSMQDSKADVTVYPIGDPRNLKAPPTIDGKAKAIQIISAGSDGSYDAVNFSTNGDEWDGNSDDITDWMR